MIARGWHLSVQIPFAWSHTDPNLPGWSSAVTKSWYLVSHNLIFSCFSFILDLSSLGDDDDMESSSIEGDSSGANMQFFEDMVGAVLEQKDSHGRIICELFKRLPPKDLYPEYYEVINEPIDIKIICTRVRSSYYTSVEDLEKDLLLMVKNAHTFNEPGSQVYKDASTIKKLIQTKKAEIDHTVMGAKSSSRLKYVLNIPSLFFPIHPSAPLILPFMQLSHPSIHPLIHSLTSSIQTCRWMDICIFSPSSHYFFYRPSHPIILYHPICIGSSIRSSYFIVVFQSKT